MNVLGDQGNDQTNIEESPTSGPSPTLFSTIIPTVLNFIRTSHPILVKPTQRPNYLVYPMPSKTNKNSVRIIDTQPTHSGNSEREEVKVMPTKHDSSTLQADSSRSIPTPLDEELIDAKNREAFNLKYNRQDDETMRRQRQEIAQFLQQIRLARSLDKSRIQLEKENPKSVNNNEEDEVYSDKEHSVILVEKKTSLEDEEEEGIEEEKVTIPPDSSTRAKEEVNENVESKKEEEESEESEKEVKDEGVKDKEVKEEIVGSMEEEENDEEEEESEKPEEESVESKKEGEEPKEQRTTTPALSLIHLSSKPKSSVQEGLSVVPTKQHYGTVKTIPKKDHTNYRKKTERKEDASQSSTKKLSQLQKELSKSTQKVKTTQKQSNPSSKQGVIPQIPSTKIWTNAEG